MSVSTLLLPLPVLLAAVAVLAWWRSRREARRSRLNLERWAGRQSIPFGCTAPLERARRTAPFDDRWA